MGIFIGRFNGNSHIPMRTTVPTSEEEFSRQANRVCFKFGATYLGGCLKMRYTPQISTFNSEKSGPSFWTTPCDNFSFWLSHPVANVSRTWTITMAFYIAWTCRVAAWFCWREVMKPSTICSCNSTAGGWSASTLWCAMAACAWLGTGWISGCSIRDQHQPKLVAEGKSPFPVCQWNLCILMPLALRWRSHFGASKLGDGIKSVAKQLMWVTAQCEIGLGFALKMMMFCNLLGEFPKPEESIANP